MAKQVCKFCHGDVQYGNLFCTVNCARAHEKKQVFHERQLVENGFEQHPDIPNVYRKGGVSVTLERVHHVGVSEAIEHHGHAVSSRGEEAQSATPEAAG